MISPKQVTELFNKYNVGPSKRFGQNFLIDEHIINKIIKASEVENKDVVEIGPGLGSLTTSLLPLVRSLTAYEIDIDMINVLKGEISDNKFTIVEGDFLQTTFNWKNKKILVANIPYNITSDILFKLFENSQKFDRAIVMIQKEVAERLLAKANDSDYSKLTVTANHFGTTSKVTIVKPTCFIPAPKVDSMVIRIDFNNNLWEDSKDFVEFIKNCFAQRRKTLFNNLKIIYGTEMALSAIDFLKRNANIRPQEVTYGEFKELFEFIKVKHLNNKS